MVRGAGVLFLGVLLCSLLLASVAEPGLAQQDLDCADFASQAEAQAVFDRDPSDPNRLDADDDGQACETTDYGTGPDDQQYENEPKKDDVIIITIPDKPLPKTGGFPLFVGAAMLLTCAAALAVRILR